MGAAILAVLLAGGVLFARRNLRLGRGDRRGATRLAMFVFALMMVTWIVGEDHALQFWEIYLFISWTGYALFSAGLLWLLYIAVEPYIRRKAPGLLVSWSRLLAGGFSDPLVGRDVAIGCAAGALAATLSCVAILLPAWVGRPAESLMLTPRVLDAPDIIQGAAFEAPSRYFRGSHCCSCCSSAAWRSAARRSQSSASFSS